MRYETFRKIRKFFFRTYFKFYHRLEVIGLENIPQGAAVIALNHGGGFDLDIVAINLCHPTREIHVLIMDKYHYINSMWGRYWIAGGIPLWLGGGIRWQYINPYLHKKGSQYPGLVCMFPEGHSGLFQHRHVIHKFFPGVVRIALKYEVPIVPVTTAGFHKISPILKEYKQEHGPPDPILFPPFTLPFKLKIEFGEPFELDDYYNMKLSKKEEWWIANRIIRPKVAKLRMKYMKVKLAKVDMEMKKPRI
ncbi:MAG: 1-acyl-sn-glycerol-3-phosphate acyltransferase [Candidatus Helarchaeota archaeon]|nr:1-acyl-sn-glycerol-3-phosphate acyltransferase [Candidatus Helarchaeota archaeon]